MSSVIGPTLGGFITDSISWNWVFFINVPIGVPVLLLIAFLFPAIKPEVENRKHDYLGMVTLVLAVVPILLALSWGGVQFGWASPQVVGLLVFGLVMIAAFVTIEHKSDSPIMPLEIYRNRMVSVSLVVTFLTGFGMFGGIIFIPLFFQGVLGSVGNQQRQLPHADDAGNRGWRDAVWATARANGVALPSLSAVGGIALMTAGTVPGINDGRDYVVCSRRRIHSDNGYAGLGSTFPTFMLAVQNTIPFRLMGTATSALQFYRSIGGMLGLALLGAVMANRFATNLEQSLPDSVSGVLPPERIEAMKENPQALVDPSALADLQSRFTGADGQQMADQFLTALKTSLSGAIGDVFTISVLLVAASLVATVFLKLPEPGRARST